MVRFYRTLILLAALLATLTATRLNQPAEWISSSSDKTASEAPLSPIGDGNEEANSPANVRSGLSYGGQLIREETFENLTVDVVQKEKNSTAPKPPVEATGTTNLIRPPPPRPIATAPHLASSLDGAQERLNRVEEIHPQPFCYILGSVHKESSETESDTESETEYSEWQSPEWIKTVINKRSSVSVKSGAMNTKAWLRQPHHNVRNKVHITQLRPAWDGRLFIGEVALINYTVPRKITDSTYLIFRQLKFGYYVDHNGLLLCDSLIRAVNGLDLLYPDKAGSLLKSKGVKSQGSFARHAKIQNLGIGLVLNHQECALNHQECALNHQRCNLNHKETTLSVYRVGPVPRVAFLYEQGEDGKYYPQLLPVNDNSRAKKVGRGSVAIVIPFSNTLIIEGWLGRGVDSLNNLETLVKETNDALKDATHLTKDGSFAYPVIAFRIY